MRNARLMVITALLLACTWSTAEAQHPQTRDGFWIGLGMGYGSMGLSCDVCDGIEREGGLSGYFKIGGALAPNLLLGAETNGWTKSEGGATVTQGNASAALYWYPAVASGFFMKGGLGWSVLSLDSDFGDDSDSGFGLVGGVGYDVRLGRNVSITPVLNYVRGSFDGGSTNVVQLAAGVTFH